MPMRPMRVLMSPKAILIAVSAETIWNLAGAVRRKKIA
jgi:hypothetical protein